MIVFGAFESDYVGFLMYKMLECPAFLKVYSENTRAADVDTTFHIPPP